MEAVADTHHTGGVTIAARMDRLPITRTHRLATVAIGLQRFSRSFRNRKRKTRVTVSPVKTRRSLFTKASRGDIKSRPHVNIATPKAIQPKPCSIQKRRALLIRLFGRICIGRK